MRLSRHPWSGVDEDVWRYLCNGWKGKERKGRIGKGR